jgi:hypothetical protein
LRPENHAVQDEIDHREDDTGDDAAYDPAAHVDPTHDAASESVVVFGFYHTAGSGLFYRIFELAEHI